MNITKSLFSILFGMTIALLSACGGGGESGGSGGGDANLLNVILDLPVEIGDKSISFTVGEGTGASVASGLTIIYDFEKDSGNVEGTNPESGNKYYPNSYSFTSTSSSVTVTLDYGSGNREVYTLYPSDSCGNEGSYSYKGYISNSEVATATGRYSIVGGICFNFDQEAPPVTTIDEIEGSNQRLELNQLLTGSVEYSSLSGSGSDQFDSYSYTVPSNKGIQLVVVNLSWDGGPDDLDLDISSSFDYPYADSFVNYQTPAVSGGRSVKYFYVYKVGGTNIPFTVVGNETGGVKNYNLVVTRDGFSNASNSQDSYHKTSFVGGQWNVTDTISNNTCGFTNAAQPDYLMDIRQTGSVLAVTSNVFSTLVGKTYSLNGLNYVSWTGSYAFMGGTLTITEMQLYPLFLGNTIIESRVSLSGGADWSWSDGNTNCSGEMLISATPTSLVSEGMSGVEVTEETGSVRAACCSITGPSAASTVEAEYPGTQVYEWTLNDLDLDQNPSSNREWEVTIEGGTPEILPAYGYVTILKQLSQAADWKLTITNVLTPEQTVFTGRIEASVPPDEALSFVTAEPNCLQNFPRGVCDAIGDPESIGLPAKAFASSTFSNVGASCSSLGYSGREITIMPDTAPGSDPGSTCTYRE